MIVEPVTENIKLLLNKFGPEPLDKSAAMNILDKHEPIEER